MNQTMTLSICQFPIAFLDWQTNKKMALQYIIQAKKEGADLIIFPEMTLTGIFQNSFCHGRCLWRKHHFFSVGSNGPSYCDRFWL